MKTQIALFGNLLHVTSVEEWEWNVAMWRLAKLLTGGVAAPAVLMRMGGDGGRGRKSFPARGGQPLIGRQPLIIFLREISSAF